MKKFFYLLIISFFAILSFVLISRFFPTRITGFVGANFSVNISEVLKGELLISYKEQLNWGEFQNITVDFLNVGSVTFKEKIEVRIFYNYEGKLQPIAYYYDSIVTLKPGERRTYRVNYLPYTIGTYYIKVRVSYDGKVIETWKAFLVIYIPPAPPVEIIPLPPEVPPPVEVVETGKPKIDLEYPEKITVVQGDSKLFSVIVKNTGQVSLKSIRLAISLPSLFEVEINPKEIFKLIPNETAVFLIYLTVPNQTLPGIYPLDFEVITDKIKEGRRINIEVVSALPDLEKEVRETIEYYEYLISEIQNQIDAAYLKGIDVSKVQEILDKARIALEEAKTYYNLGKYLDAKKKLNEVKDYLQETVFQLSLALIPIYYPAFPFLPFILLLVIILAIIIALILIRRKKKEELKRPKLLRGIET
ncbi:MAG: NEW3 domain-containing protein [Candidatus Aenigmarchaeota archaeon]|nr:NEW3 domain-containing protein [Candidatus Aenigmarchaeota archaeon]